MKKSLIALAVLAASGAAMAQSSVTLFGIVDTGVSYVDNAVVNDAKYGVHSSGNATSRLGLRGTEDLGGGLKAGFWLEGEIFGDDGNASGFNFKRRSTVSLSGNFGEVRLGRDQVPTFQKLTSYDLFSATASTGTGVVLNSAFQPEASLQTTTQVFRAAQAQTARGSAAGAQAVTAVASCVLVHVGNASVDDTEQGHGGLSHCGAGSSQHCQGNQRFFHYELLQGLEGRRS